MTDAVPPGFFELFFRLGLVQLPLLVVVIAGIAFTLSRRHRHPKLALRVAAGLGLIGAYALAQTLRISLTVHARIGAPPGEASVDEPRAVVTYAIYLLLLAGIVLLATAVFMARRGARQTDALPAPISETDR